MSLFSDTITFLARTQVSFDILVNALTGTCKGLRFENGTLLRLDDIINEQLQDDVHVWVILKGIDIERFLIYRGHRGLGARAKSW
jgi:hypothetical protein